MAKRCFDIFASTLGLILLSPVLIVIALACFLSQGMPILFRQRRVGRQGLCFTLYKFRTMQTAPEAETGSFEPGNTARVTSLGRLLRKSKLDELPQLWNVLRGDMSLVGPRPEIEKWVAVYSDRWNGVHAVRPGITDPASIAYHNEEELLCRATDPETTYHLEILPQKLLLYEDYVRTRTFLGDMKILFRTIAALLPIHQAPERP